MLPEINQFDIPLFIWAHLGNARSHMQHGFFCDAAPVQMPGYVTIGYPDQLDRRKRRGMPAPIGGTLADWVGFHLTPRTPAAFNIQTGVGVEKRSGEELVVFVTSYWKLQPFGGRPLVADRTPTSSDAVFEEGPAGLRLIDYPLLSRGVFANDPSDPNRKTRFGAQVLISRFVSPEAFIEIGCFNEAIRAQLQELADALAPYLRISVKRKWFF